MTDATFSTTTTIVDLHHNPDSPSVDSPATPINNNSGPDVKIDIDFHEESDVRHEPLPLRVDKMDKASTFAQLGTSLNPVISIHRPNGTSTPGQVLHDVRMGEEGSPPMLSPPPTANDETDSAMIEPDTETRNGYIEEDISMEEKIAAGTPGSLPATSPTTVADTSDQLRVDDNDHDPEDQPPPAKRARKYSNADEESVLNTATPPPATASTVYTNGVSTPIPQPLVSSSSSSATGSSLTQAQFKFCLSSIRQVKKSKDAKPFLYPVDYLAMNIPHYPSIITHPMDFTTIERKLNASNPAKPDPNPDTPRYHTAEEFVADVRLIFSNCVKFNGPEHQITHMGRRVEELFDKSLKNLPGPEEPKPPVVKKAPVQPAPPPPPPPPTAPPVSKRVNARRSSTSVPTIRRNDGDGSAVSRPKREIHPPPPKDLPYADAPKKPRKARASKDNLNAEQLKFCSKILADLHRKTHWAIASPFYEPVDWVTLELPSYPKVVKRPMDLSTMRKRLDNHEYPNANKFFDDFKLMIRNCFLFNPPGTPVNQAGIDLQRLFDEKWKSLPQPRSHAADDFEVEQEDEETDEDRDRGYSSLPRRRGADVSESSGIAEMESQIEIMRGNITALKKKSEKKVKKVKPYAPPVASTSKASAKGAARMNPKKKGGRKSGASAPVDDDVLTFEQKKDLSEAIATLEGTKLERVITIIHEGVPEIRDSTEEIELEIDLLPAHVLTKLYNFVIRPSLRTTAPKRTRTGKGTGTGGLKRKSMDEDVEAEKIRQLEARMALFENPDGAAPGVAQALANGHDSDRSSDSSDQSDSSGSDSE